MKAIWIFLSTNHKLGKEGSTKLDWKQKSTHTHFAQVSKNIHNNVICIDIMTHSLVVIFFLNHNRLVHLNNAFMG